MEETHSSSGALPRLRFLDTLKGVLIISCVLFHLVFDLKYLYGQPIPWFEGTTQDFWRCSIAWPFIFIAGYMCAYSRDNLKRAGRYLGVAALIFAATSLSGLVTPISFGIIYCMGACTLTVWLLERVGIRPKGVAVCAVLIVVFLAVSKIHHGILGFGPLSVPAPATLYSSPYLAWLGFPGPGFASSDYYPLLPHLLLFAAGTAVGSALRESEGDSWMYRVGFPPLELLGRWVLPIYLAHQPLIVALITLLQPLFG